ncbi:hypothetical protein [Microvirga yunnanensis]|nr:hypothetical protein [Microvirga sp. HBU65207]
MEIRPDPVRLIEQDLIPDFEHEEAPFRSGTSTRLTNPSEKLFQGPGG